MGYLDSAGLETLVECIKNYVQSRLANYTANKATADAAGNNIASTYATKAELSAIPQFDIQVVNALPTANISDTTVYLVLSNSGAAGNLYTEYIHVNDTWEKLGEQTTEVDLSDYMPLSGGTLTGNIYTTPYYDATIENPEGGQTLIVSKGASTKGTLPAEDEWHTLVMAVDNTGSTNNAHKYGQIETAVRANGRIYTFLQAFKNEADSTTAASIEVGYDADGNVYTAAPTPAATDNSTKIATTAYVNTKLSEYSTTSHTHNYAGSASDGGAATSANKLATGKAIDGVTFDGSAAIVHYGTCSTAADTVAKTVACASFILVTGSRIVVKFTVTNTAANPTLNVNSTGAKAIQYHGEAISAGYLAANRTYEFVYDGTNYQLVGDINTNTTYSAGTTALLKAGADTKNRVWPAKQIADYVDDKVADLVNSAPDTLDTLSELANALGDDPNFATTVATQIGNISTQVSGKVESDSANYLKSAGVSGSTLTLTKGDDTTVTFTANNYTHPTTAGNKHIPSGGSSGQILRWSAAGTAAWGAEQSISNLFDLSIGTEIPANADLNTYKTPGVYYAADSTRAKTLSNCPHTSSNFKLVVMTGGITTTYLMQYLFASGSGGGSIIYARSYGNTSTGWYAWKRIAFQDDIETYSAGTGLSLSSANAFSLATSGATAGSYGPSANASPAHGGTFSVPYVTVDTYGRVTAASTKTITLPADSNTDTKVTSTATEPTSATSWYPICSTASTTNTTTTVKNPELRVSVLEGTASAEGKVEIVLGNSTATGTAGNKTGWLSLYNNKGKWTSVRPHTGDTENRTIYTPKAGGTLVVHTTDTAIGGTATPVYISAAGVATAISADVGSATNPVYLDGGTIKKTTYTLGKSVPSNAVFTDHTYSNFVKSGSSAAAGLVPKPSTTAGTTHYLREDGTWTVPPDTKYSNMTAATADAAGKAGLVPAPAAGKQTSFLRGDGTWVVPTNTTYSAGTAALLTAGTNETNRVWSAKILSDFVESKCTPGSSIAANGYVKLDSGLIIQWGKYTPTTSGVQTFNPFAIDFPSACYSIVFWFAVNSGGASGCYPTAAATKNSVTGHFYNLPYYWIAIGK